MRYNAAMIKPIKTYSLNNLKQLMKDLGQPSFRAKQLYEWLYLPHVGSYDSLKPYACSCPPTTPCSLPLSSIPKPLKTGQPNT